METIVLVLHSSVTPKLAPRFELARLDLRQKNLPFICTVNDYNFRKKALL